MPNDDSDIFAERAQQLRSQKKNYKGSVIFKERSKVFKDEQKLIDKQISEEVQRTFNVDATKDRSFIPEEQVTRRLEQIKLPGRGRSKKAKAARKKVWDQEQGFIDSYIHACAERDVESRKKVTQEGLFGSLARGYKSGVTGLLTGRPDQSMQEQDFLGKLTAGMGRIASDMPAMIPGAAVGATFGPIGSMAGAFAAPQLINTAYNEYLDFIKSGNDLTFGEFLGRTATVGKETGKSAIIGGITGFAGRLLPFMRLSPKFSKLLDRPASAALAKGALEVGGMATGQRITEGEWPSAEDLAQNMLTIAAMHGSQKVGEVTGLSKKLGGLTTKARGIVSDTAEHALTLVPDPVEKGFLQTKKYLEKFSPRKLFVISEKERPYFDMLKDFLGVRNARYVASQMKWAEEVDNLGELSDRTWQDMIYYRQKTKNPNVPNDSYKKLVKRMPANAKNFVDTVVDSHFKMMLKAWNDHPATQNINPREAVENIYLVGLYEYDQAKFAKAGEEFTRQFKTRNPLSNPKKFQTYLEALEQKGLKPRYNNMAELMQAYDRIMIKSMSNYELLSDIKKTEKASRKKLIVRSTDKDAYNKAKMEGFVPFYDYYLRREVTGTKDGKPVYTTTGEPAMVDPNFATAFKGVFNKQPYSPPWLVSRAYDSVTDLIRFGRVALSGFHYGALTESAIGAMGAEGINFKKWLDEGAYLRKNKEFMQDAVKHGLKVDAGAFLDYDVGKSWVDKAIQYSSKKLMGEKASKKILRGMTYMFDHFHPRLKLVTWRRFIDKAITDSIADGKPLSGQELTGVKREMAELVNNIYGGQNWEMQKFFNDPRATKFLKRLIGYPDWTISAVRQAADTFAPGLKGDQARVYWIKYGIGMSMYTAISRLINSGFEQTDKDESPLGVRWNPKKAFSGLVIDDPKNWYKIPLPDIDIKVAGRRFRMGRDERGRKLYTHPGKQALEIGHYYTDPIKSIFSKSNPIIQMIATQIFGGQPSGGGVYPAQEAYVGGRRLPWGGAKPGSWKNIGYRAKEVVESPVPFSVRGVMKHGILPTIATGAILPISKSLSLYDSEPHFKKALQENNAKKLNAIKKMLKDNGYSNRQIKSRITRVRNEIKRSK